MKIYIPSLGRADRIRNGQSTICELPKSAWSLVTYVVPVAQEALYRSALQWHTGAQVVACPEVGIAATRRWMTEHCPEEKILQLDDDIKFQVRKSFETSTFETKPSASSLEDMLAAVDTMLDTYAHGGISDRVAGSRAPLGVGPPCIVEDTRLLRALAYRKTEHQSCEHGRVDVMEDFDIALQLLRRGYHSGNIAWWVQDQRSTQWKGGCSTYRTHEVHEQSARRLAELHPGLVSLRQKENKTGGAFGTRTEVTIQWKKAFNAG